MMVVSITRLHALTPLLVMMMTAFAVGPRTAAGGPASDAGGAATSVWMVMIMQRVMMMMRRPLRDARMIPLGGGVGDFRNPDVFVHADGRTKRIWDSNEIRNDLLETTDIHYPDVSGPFLFSVLSCKELFQIKYFRAYFCFK